MICYEKMLNKKNNRIEILESLDTYIEFKVLDKYLEEVEAAVYKSRNKEGIYISPWRDPTILDTTISQGGFRRNISYCTIYYKNSIYGNDFWSDLRSSIEERYYKGNRNIDI